MTQYQQFFTGKRVTVMGLGLLGRGIGDVRFLSKQGAQLVVTDLKTADQLADSLAALKDCAGIEYRLGGHQPADFHNADMVLKAAGVPFDSPFIAEARKRGVPVYMSTALFAQFAGVAGVTVVGITGTRGKTTTTYLIYEMLRRAGKKAWLGGNVPGVSTLALLPQVAAGDVAVLELDSWQLQGFGDLKLSPPVAVFTNFMPDHLNYYKGDMERYRADKENIFKFQKPGDTAIRGWELDAGEVADWPTKLLGEHNRQNIACAVAAGRALGVSDAVLKEAVAEFAGVPGRLELVREWRGIKIYNDTTATTPDATLAALTALGPAKTILIMGGADKQLDMSKLVVRLGDCKAVILLPGTGTEKLRSYKLEAKSLHEASSLQEAVASSIKLATAGDSILLSPAFASFGPPPGGFKNEYDRGTQFVNLIKGLK